MVALILWMKLIIVGHKFLHDLRDIDYGTSVTLQFI